MLEQTFGELDRCDVDVQRLMNSLNGRITGKVIDQVKQAQQCLQDIRQSLVGAVANSEQKGGTNEEQANRPGSPVQPGLVRGTKVEGSDVSETAIAADKQNRQFAKEHQTLQNDDLPITATPDSATGGGGGTGSGLRGSQGEDRSGPGVALRKDGQIDKRTVEGPDRRAGEKVGG